MTVISGCDAILIHSAISICETKFQHFKFLANSMWAIINILIQQNRKKRNSVFHESQRSRALTSRHVNQTEGSTINEAIDIVANAYAQRINLSRKRIILLAPRGNQDVRRCGKISLTLQTGTSVRETSTLKHGSKYWKLLETLETFLLCFLNAGFYFASLSSIFVSRAKLANTDDATLFLSEEITWKRKRKRKRERESFTG